MKTLIAAYILCFLFNFGCLNAHLKGFGRDLDRRYPSSEPTNMRHMSAVAGGFSMAGPIVLLATPFITDFYEYGFDFKVGERPQR